MSTVWEHLLAFISDNLDHEYRVPWNEKCSKTLSKVYSFHIHSSCRRRTTPCVALHCEPAAAAPKLKWHFLAAASRQKAPFCPFTSNLCDTYVLYTVGSLKKTHSRHRGDRFWVSRRTKFMVPAYELMETSLKMRNKFHWHLRGGCTKEAAQGLKLSAVYISLVQKYLPLLSCIGPREQDQVSLTIRLRWNVTLAADRVGIWIISLIFLRL